MDAFDTLVARGFVQNCSGEDVLRRALRKPITFYAGFDPTADSLHVGHLIPFMAMAWLQRLGHRAIVVIGGGTAMVGDPSGRTELRQMLSHEQVRYNAQRYLQQVAPILELDGVKGILVDNAEWLLELRYIDFLRDIGRHFSVNRMLAAEAYRQRLERGLSFIEFNYQLLQAYDYLELHRRFDCTLQLGGDDQWGNILAGTELIRRVTGHDVYGLTHPLILTAGGQKMGKTADGAVWLDPEKVSPFDYYQYWLNCHDDDVVRFLKLFTFLPLERIEALGRLQGAEIREAKRVLAREATALIHGREAAERAEAAARAMVAGAASEDLPTVEVGEGDDPRVVAVLVKAGLTRSLGEGRRLIRNGGVRLDGAKLDDPEAAVDLGRVGADGLVLRVGKKRAARIVARGSQR